MKTPPPTTTEEEAEENLWPRPVHHTEQRHEHDQRFASFRVDRAREQLLFGGARISPAAARAQVTLLRQHDEEMQDQVEKRSPPAQQQEEVEESSIDPSQEAAVTEELNHLGTHHQPDIKHGKVARPDIVRHEGRFRILSNVFLNGADKRNRSHVDYQGGEDKVDNVLRNVTDGKWERWIQGRNLPFNSNKAMTFISLETRRSDLKI